jgi:hypothetical protein
MNKIIFFFLISLLVLSIPYQDGSAQTILTGTQVLNNNPIVYSTLLGGNANDLGSAIKVDKFGDAYVTGVTTSTDFPITSGAYTHNVNPDEYNIFVSKMNSTGSKLIYSSFFGGKLDNWVFSIDIDSIGESVITGHSQSDQYPTTPDSYNPKFHHYTDIVVTKINSKGSALVYSTFIGDYGYDDAYDMCLDPSANAYITGGTQSATYPTTIGAYNKRFKSYLDMFVTKLNAAGSGLVYSTFIDMGEGIAIAIDTTCNVFITGYTGTDSFPITPGAFRKNTPNQTGIFVTKLNPTGSSLVYSTYIDELNADEGGKSIHVDKSGNAYICGHTWADDYPVTNGSYLKGQDDYFVTKLNSTGSALDYSTYIGGSGIEYMVNMTLFKEQIIIAGATYSTDYPVTPDAIEKNNNSICSLVMTSLDNIGSIVYSTYFPGSTDTYGKAITCDSIGDIYLSGSAISSNFITTDNSYDRTLKGQTDAFIMKLSFPPKPILQVGDVSGKPGDIVEVPIYLKNPVAIKNAGITKLNVDLSFNSTLLAPIVVPKGTVQNSIRTIPLTLPVNPDTNFIISKIKMIVGLGNTEQTPLKLKNLVLIGGTSDIDTVDGKFTLLGICNEGGNRLLNPSDTVKLLIAKPNPAGNEVEIGYQLIESGRTSLFITNANGEVIKTIFDKEISDYNYNTIRIDTREMPSGSYFVILQTPTERQSLRLEVVK